MVSPSNVSLFPSLPSFLSSSTSTHALHVYPFVSCYLSSLLFHLSLSQISSVLFSSSSLLTLSSICNLCLPSLHTATKLKILHFTFPLSLFHLVFFISLCSSAILSPFSPIIPSLICCHFSFVFSTCCIFSAWVFSSLLPALSSSLNFSTLLSFSVLLLSPLPAPFSTPLHLLVLLLHLVISPFFSSSAEPSHLLL